MQAMEKARQMIDHAGKQELRRCLVTAGIDDAIIDRWTPEQQARIAAMPYQDRIAWLFKKRANGLIQSGERPPEWAKICQCNQCGPVYLAASSPSRVETCPWCVRTQRGMDVPRPPTCCATCRFQIEKPATSEAGVHACGRGHAVLFAYQPNDCRDWAEKTPPG